MDKAVRAHAALIAQSAYKYLTDFFSDSFSKCCDTSHPSVGGHQTLWLHIFSRIHLPELHIFGALVHKHQLYPRCNYSSICSHQLWYLGKNCVYTLHGGRGVFFLRAISCRGSLLKAIYYTCIYPKYWRGKDKMTFENYFGKTLKCHVISFWQSLWSYSLWPWSRWALLSKNSCLLTVSPWLWPSDFPSFWVTAAATWSARTTWWRRSTMTAAKSSRRRSDASSC